MKEENRIEFIEEDPELLPDILRKVLSGEYALLDVNNLLTLRQLVGKDKCEIRKEDFHFSKESFLPTSAGLPIRKGFPHTNTINWRLLWYRAFGLDVAGMDLASQADKVRGLHSPVKMPDKCDRIQSQTFPLMDCPSEAPKDAPKPLSIHNLRGVFLILASGLAVSLIVLFAEIARHLFQEYSARRT